MSYLIILKVFPDFLFPIFNFQSYSVESFSEMYLETLTQQRLKIAILN